ncbi:Dedicator of cytokinesis protein [Entamoeba marina]
MAHLLKKYGFKSNETDVPKMHAKSKSSYDQKLKIEADNEFTKFDTDQLEELDFYQIRTCLEKYKLVLSDEEIKSILQKTLLNEERITHRDFPQFLSYIHEIKTSGEFSAQPKKNVRPCDIFESQLKDDNVPKSSVIYKAGDVSIVHNPKPTIATITLRDVMTEKEIIGAEQQLYLDMLFNPTTEIVYSKNTHEKLRPKSFPSPQIKMEANDSPNPSLLKRVQLVDIRSPQTNLYDNYLNDVYFSGSALTERESNVTLNNPNDVGTSYIMQIKAKGLINYEPFFGEFAIYQVTDDSINKITENFFVDLNTPDNKKLVQRIEKDEYDGTTTYQFVFKSKTIVEKEKKLYGVLFLYKMAEQDLDSSRQFYKEKIERIGKEKKDINEMNDENKQQPEKICYKFYKQHIFTGIQELNANSKRINLCLYKDDIHSEMDLFKLILNIQMGKAKPLEMRSWELSINKLTDSLSYQIYDPSGFPLRKNVSTNKPQTPIHQIEDFTRSESNKMFFTDFVNNIYIYPTELDIPKERKKCSFIIHCYIRKEDVKFHREDTYLPLFYSSTSVQNTFHRKASTSVSVNAKVDYFLDEIKAMLPVVLTPQHHLLFVIQEVLLTNDNNEPTEKMVKNSYFAFMPFIQKGKIIEDDEHVVTVYTGLPYDNYITTKPTESPDKKQQILKFKIRVISDIYTRSLNVHRLINSIHTNFKSLSTIESAFQEMEKDIQEKKEANKFIDLDLLHTFPILMKLVFKMYTFEKIDPVRVFKYLLRLCQIVSTSLTSFSQPIKLFTKYYLVNGEKVQPLFIFLLNSLVSYFTSIVNNSIGVNQDHSDNIKFLPTTLKMLPLLYQMIEKSLVLYLDGSKLICIVHFFDNSMLNYAKVFALFMRKGIKDRAEKNVYLCNIELANFCTSIIRIYSRKTIVRFVDEYLTTLTQMFESSSYLGSTTTENPIEKRQKELGKRFAVNTHQKEISTRCQEIASVLRVEFVQVLSSFEYFYECNVPKITPVTTVSDYFTNSFNNHFLAAYIQRQYMFMLRKGNNIAKMALYGMVLSAIKMDISDRLQQRRDKTAIAEFHSYSLNYIITHADEFIKIFNVSIHNIIDYTSFNNAIELVETPQISPLKNTLPTEHSSMKIEEVQHFYLYIVWILKNIDIRTLSQLLNKDTHERISNLLKILQYSVKAISQLSTSTTELFKNIKKAVDYSKLFVTESNPTTTEHNKTNEALTSPSPTRLSTGISTITTNNNLNVLDDSMVVILQIALLCFNKRFFSINDSVMIELTQLITSFFDIPLTATFFKTFMSFLRKIIIEFPEYFFEHNPTFCFNVIKGILKLCGETSPVIRKNAVSVLYLLLKTNFERDEEIDVMRIHITSSLASMKITSDMSHLIQKSTESISQWVELDFANDITTPIEKEKSEKSIDKYKRYRHTIFKKRMDLLELIDKEKNPNDGLWRSMKQVIIYLEGIWKNDMTDELMNRIDKLKDDIDLQVTREEKADVLKTCIVYQMKDFVDVSKNILSFLMVEKELEAFEERKNHKLNKLTTTLMGIKDTYDKFDLIQIEFPISFALLKSIVDNITELYQIRLDTLQKEVDSKTLKTKTKEDFDSLLQIHKKELCSEYHNLFNFLQHQHDNIHEGDEIVPPSDQQQYSKTNQTTTLSELDQLENKLYQFEENIKTKQNVMKQEDKKNGINVWEVLYDQWELILPKTIHVFSELVNFQTSILSYEKEVIELGKKAHVQLAAAEELIKIYVWCLGVDEVRLFVPGDLSFIIARAEMLMKQIPIIDQTMVFVTQHYRPSRDSNRSVRLSTRRGKFSANVGDLDKELSAMNDVSDMIHEKLFGKLFTDIAKCGNWKTILVTKTQELLALQSIENEKVEKRLEYANIIKSIANGVRADVLHDIIPLAEKAQALVKNDPDAQTKCNKEDLTIITELSEKNEAFAKAIGKKVETEHKKTETFKEKFSGKVNELIKYSKVVLNDLNELEHIKQTQSAELLSEQYWVIAEKYQESLELHIEWYLKLIQNQIEHENYVEAGIGYVHIISVVYKFLKKNQIITIDLDENLLKDITEDFLDVHYTSYLDHNIYFSIKYLFQTIQKAACAFKDSNLQHYSISLYKFILPYFSSIQHFVNLSECHQNITDLYKEICDSRNYVGFFYRVSFYGKAFMKLFNTCKRSKKVSLIEYVYRSSNRTADFVLFLQNSYESIRHLQVITKSVSDLKELNKKENYIFISSVSPYINQKISDRFVPTNTFASEISFTIDNARLDVLDKVHKKRTIIQTQRHIPSVLEREMIVNLEEIILSPILSCMDDIEKQIENLMSITNYKKSFEDKIPQLQRLLMGILCANVNGGLFAVCNTFLSEETIKKYERNNVEKLFERITFLLELCKKGLALHKSHMKAEFSNLQNVMESGYLNIEKTIKVSGSVVKNYTPETLTI